MPELTEKPHIFLVNNLPGCTYTWAGFYVHVSRFQWLIVKQGLGIDKEFYSGITAPYSSLLAFLDANREDSEISDIRDLVLQRYEEWKKISPQ